MVELLVELLPMASISKKHNSPFWMAKFRDDTGRIVMRSTKQTGDKAARKIADAWEEASTKARRGDLTRSTALKVLAELVERTTGEALVDSTVCDFLNEWLESRRVNGRAVATLARYRPIVSKFIASLGTRATKTVRGVTGSDLRKFRDAQVAEGRSAVTANLSLKVLKAAFEQAKREGLILTNPAAELDTLGEDGESRLAFTDEQIRQLLASAGEEWTGMVLLGVHAGLRMSDAANLKWQNVDLKAGTVTLIPRKTRRTKKDKTITIALHQDILSWVLKWRKINKGAEILFPTLCERSTGSHTGLSNEFGRLMQKAKIEGVFGEEKTGKGRRTTLLSFHSLRHSCISRLANADVSPDVRKNISGHSTDEAHSRYTHLAVETQRRALKLVNTLLPE